MKTKTITTEQLTAIVNKGITVPMQQQANKEFVETLSKTLKEGAIWMWKDKGVCYTRKGTGWTYKV